MRHRLRDSLFALLFGFAAASAQAGTTRLWLVPSPDNAQQQGFIRVTNPGSGNATVNISAADDNGTVTGPTQLTLGPRQSVHLNSQDLRMGNAGKGLAGGLGTPAGEWWLEMSSAQAVVVGGYLRTPDGFVSSMHDTVPMTGNVATVSILNPGNNLNQVGELRIVNPNSGTLSIDLTGIDDAGVGGLGTVKLSLPARSGTRITAAELESGMHPRIVSGRLGTGVGKWRLSLSANGMVRVMSLIRDPLGYLTNLSTLPESVESGGGGLTCADIDGASVLSQEPEPVYLGFLGNSIGAHSIRNPSGPYGSTTGTRSVRNAFSAYGSSTGVYSARNSLSINPPLIVKNGKVLAALTANAGYSRYPALSLPTIDGVCLFFSASRAGL